MIQGKVEAVNSKGYGFISTKEGIDYFFHFSQFQGEWRKLVLLYIRGYDVNVEFESDPTATDGPRAVNVRVINDKPERARS